MGAAGWEVPVTGILKEQLADVRMETQTPLGRLPFPSLIPAVCFEFLLAAHHCWSLPSGVKSRPHTLCCFDSSCKIRRALNGLTVGSPSHMAPGDKIHWPNKPPHHRNQHSPCSSLNRRLQFPASPQNYSNRPAASPEGARDRPHPPTLILQSLPPTVPGYSLSS